MPPNSIRPGQGRTSPFVKPFLHALNRMQERETLRPEQLCDRAGALLSECFGASPHPVATDFAFGDVGLVSDHTNYFDGFAFMMALPYGTAVAVRCTDAGTSQVVFEDGTEHLRFDAAAAPTAEAGEPAPWSCLILEVVARMRPSDVQVEAAVVSTVLPCCTEGYLAALGVAAGRALHKLAAPSEHRPVPPRVLQALLSTCTRSSFTPAYPIAAEAGRPGAFTLVDTSTFEHLPVEAPPAEAVGWGLVDVKAAPLHDASYYRAQQARTEEALALLQQRGFGRLRSFRELEHRTLQRALDVLPRALRPLVRHLVTENQRVPKLVAAARRRDWQMFGALLLMSHASQQSDGEGTLPEADLVVEQVEAMSIDGMYGARAAGRGAGVVLVGQPFVVPACLDRIKKAFEERFGTSPETMLL